MKFAAILFLLALILHPAVTLAQYPQAGHVSLRGTVSAKVMMTASAVEVAPAAAGDLSARMLRESDERVSVTLQGSGQSPESAASARLLLRTNTGYGVRAFLKSQAAAPAVKLIVESVRATGAGVVPAALAGARFSASAADLTSAPALILTGPRVSCGPASSPYNALEVTLRFELGKAGAGAWSADVVVEITPL